MQQAFHSSNNCRLIAWNFIHYVYGSCPGSKNELNKNIKWYALCFLAAILPFGTFVLDKQLKKEQDER